MIVCVCGRIDIESVGEATIALETEALLGAFKRGGAGGEGVEPCGEAANILLAVKTGTGYHRHGSTGAVFFAGKRGVARVEAHVLAGFPRFAAWLRAVGAGNAGVFTLSRPVAGFAALVGSALQLLFAR